MILTNIKQINQVIDKALAHNKTVPIDIDTETTGLDSFRGDRIVGIPLYSEALPEPYYIPVRHVGKNADPEAVFNAMRRVLCDSSVWIDGHNFKFDEHMFYADGITVTAKVLDTMLGWHLVDENEPSFKLETLGEKYVDAEAGEAERRMIAKHGKDFKSRMAYFTADEVHDYGTSDVRTTAGLRGCVKEQLKNQDLLYMWREYADYHRTVTRMERWGLPINVEAATAQAKFCTAQQTVLLDRIQREAGFDYNPNSHPQTRKLLGLPDGASTDKDALAASNHPMAKLIREYRIYTKLRGSYFEPMVRGVDPNNRFHPDVQINGTRTGRPSIWGLNWLAIPRENDDYHVRQMVEAPPGWKIVSFDWSQIEIRVLAHFCQDPYLMDAYNEGKDLHQEIADLLGIDRDTAKRLNLGMVYGLGGESFAAQAGLEVDEGKFIVNGFHTRIPGVRRLYKQCQSFATQHKYITMMDGRKRRFDKLAKWETRKAMSGKIQGSVAGLMRRDQVEVDQKVVCDEVQMLLQVYDDLIFLIRDEMVYEAASEIKEIMERKELRVPVEVEIKIGQTWGTAKKIKTLDKNWQKQLSA